MMCGWALFTPGLGFRLRGGRRDGIAALVRELMLAARRGGYITIFDDEVIQ